MSRKGLSERMTFMMTGEPFGGCNDDPPPSSSRRNSRPVEAKANSPRVPQTCRRGARKGGSRSWAQGLLPALGGPHTASRAWGLRTLPPETQGSKGRPPSPDRNAEPPWRDRGTAQGTSSQHAHACVLRGRLREPSKAPCAVFIPAVKNISDGLAFDPRVPTGLQRERRDSKQL